MKIRSIAAAAAALAACGAAQALTIEDVVASRTAGTLKEIYIAGASAQRLFIGAWFQSRCKATGATNTFDVFFSGTEGSSTFGNDYRAYSCELKSATGNYPVGTKMLLVKRDLGGSSQGVNPIATDTAGATGNTNQSLQTFMQVDTNCVRTANARPTLDILSPTYACGTTTTSRLADAGVSDLEPALFSRPVNLLAPAVALTTTQQNNLNVGTINQTIFGIAVNTKAYRALQATQGLTQDDADANRPTLPSTWVAGALRGDILGDGGVASPQRRGWGLVISSSVDATVEQKAVNVCRRNIGSGTQAAFNVHFLNAGCATPATNVNLIPGGQSTTATNSTVTGVTGPTGQLATGTNRFIVNSSAGNVETCMTNTENLAGDAYAIGILSRENTATPTGANPPVDKGYRFVKLDGDAPLRDLAKVGDYDFVYNATMQWNKLVQTDADKISFLSNMRTNAGRATSLNVADVDTQQGVLAPPATYTGPYASLTDPTTLKFASRVDRGANQSCSSLRIVR